MIVFACFSLKEFSKAFNLLVSDDVQQTLKTKLKNSKCCYLFDTQWQFIENLAQVASLS